MGISELFHGGFMWLCDRSWFQKLIVVLLLCQFVYVQTVYAFAPIAVGGRIVLTRVLGNVVTKRAIASVAANEASVSAVASLRTIQTFRSLGTVAANDAKFALSATSTLRHAKDISWVHLALASGAITLNDLNVEGNDSLNVVFEPSAVKLSDGRYAINVNGETKIVTANPSKSSPAIYTYLSKETKQISDEEVFLNDNLNNQYKYYGELNNGSFAQSNAIEDLSEYLAQELYGGKNSEELGEVTINDKKHTYLSNKTEVTNTYLRHSQFSDFISATVRQKFEEWRLNYRFDVETSGITAEGQWIYSFNAPSFPTDYEYSTYERSVPYIRIQVNANFVGEPVSPQAQQLGSISDIDSGLFNTRPLTAQQIANMYNALLLSAASQVGYEGVPFSPTNPITAQEVQASLQELGLSQPTFQDLFTKAGTGDQITFEYTTNTSPAVNPSPSTNPNTRPNEGDRFDEDADLSELEYPELETPTAREILEPFNQFFPQLKNFKLNSYSAQCPKWQIDISFLKFNYELKEHCELIEAQKNLIKVIFSILWGFIALRHLLSA